MNSSARLPKISAVVSDVDGTLVTDGKILTEGARAAVAELRANGIAFTIVSSRPPRGLRMLIEPLEITAPIAGFNGGMLATPELATIEEHVSPPATAQKAVDVLSNYGVEVWVFRGGDWLVRNTDGLYVDREMRTVQFRPSVAEDFGTVLQPTNKIVGVSSDFDLLTQCENAARSALGDDASIVRSQRYYLDITPRAANKGAAVLALSKLMGIPIEEIAVIGDGDNDVAMFERCGLSIAMGNASVEVQKKAKFVTGSNAENGFAQAMKKYVLGDGVADVLS